MTRSRLTNLFVLALLSAPLAGLTPASGHAAARTCLRAGTGMLDNVWQGGNGSWSDASHWSLGTAPSTGSGQYACIPPNVEVDLESGRVDLQSLELGKGASLTLAEGSALYVWGGADQESLLRKGSLLVVRGATLGGPGQLHVIGTVQVANTKDTQARLSGDGSTTGLMLVGDDGSLDLVGDFGDARLTGGYTVDVRGRARMLQTAGLVADSGTRLELGAHFADDGAGRLVIRNDRGYFAPEGADPLSELVNEGRIVKRESTGNSAINATYSGDGEIRIRQGHLVLPDAADQPAEVGAGASVGSGVCADDLTCVTDTTPEEQQFASLTLPGTTDGFVDVEVTSLDGAKVTGGSVGDPIKVHAEDFQASVADPVVIELRYDRTLLKAEGRPFESDALTVGHSYSGNSYDDVPDCAVGGLIPATAFACVDRRAFASREDGDDVILVVRTTRTSRWIAH